jgi:hypothetical protein
VFDSAAQTLERLSGLSLSDKQIERVCHHYGQELEAQSREEDPPGSSGEGLHYAMMDGSMILTRHKDVKGKCKWAEMKLGRVFKAAAHVQLGDGEVVRGWIRSSRYVAHLGDCDDFFDKMMPLLDPLKQLVVVADGAKWIWERIQDYYPSAIQILDFYHAVEHLADFAAGCSSINFKTDQQRRRWLDEQKILLLNDGLQRVCQNIRQLKTDTPEQVQQQEALLNYYQNNRSRMNYQHYRAQGWLIGSGPIESAHRQVIQKRLKLSGQRWSLTGAQQVANLRVAWLSGQWQKLNRLIKIRA